MSRLGEIAFGTGIYEKVYIITNNYAEYVLYYLQKLNIDTKNIVIMGLEDFYKHNLVGKPNSKIMSHFLSKNNLTENIIYIGDTQTDVIFAMNSNVDYLDYLEMTERLEKEIYKVKI